MKKALIALTAILLVSFNMNAQVNSKENRNLKGERKRVAQGVRSGEITKPELVKINNEKKDVKKAVKCATADGVVTKKEKARIARQDRQLDRTIARTKHNKRDRN